MPLASARTARRALETVASRASAALASAFAWRSSATSAASSASAGRYVPSSRGCSRPSVLRALSEPSALGGVPSWTCAQNSAAMPCRSSISGWSRSTSTMRTERPARATTSATCQPVTNSPHWTCSSTSSGMPSSPQREDVDHLASTARQTGAVPSRLARAHWCSGCWSIRATRLGFRPVRRSYSVSRTGSMRWPSSKSSSVAASCSGVILRVFSAHSSSADLYGLSPAMTGISDPPMPLRRSASQAGVFWRKAVAVAVTTRPALPARWPARRPTAAPGRP